MYSDIMLYLHSFAGDFRSMRRVSEAQTQLQTLTLRLRPKGRSVICALGYRYGTSGIKASVSWCQFDDSSAMSKSRFAKIALQQFLLICGLCPTIFDPMKHEEA